MITNREGTQLISSLGWVDRGALWVYTSGDATPRTLTLSDAKYLSLKPGANGFFAVVHHWDGRRLEISAHHHREPNRILSRLLLEEAGDGPSCPRVSLAGEHSVWRELPRAFTGFAFGDYQLVLTSERETQTFGWFDKSYDKAYQGIVDVTEVPDTNLLIVSIARDSAPVLYDPVSRQAMRKLKLADRCGNPEFQLRRSAHEFWASDYDSIVKLSTKSLDLIAAKRIQDARSGTMQFIGSFCFDREEAHCLIARPFSGDALVLDADSMRIDRTIELGGQPLKIGLLDAKVVARDWKSGRLLSREP